MAEITERVLTDLELERWLADDLPADRARGATAADRARLDELRREHAAFLASVDLDAELRAIRQRGAGAGGTRRNATRRAWLVPAGALAAAALVLVIVLRGRSPAIEADLRPKGGSIGLSIHVATGSGSRTLATGEPVHPGDRIRFEVSAPRAGQVAIVGLDGAGVSTVYYPSGGRTSAAIDPGAGAVLPGAVRLDATPGDERIYAVYAERPFAIDDALVAALRAGDPAPGIAVVSVVLHKTD
jgi:hypothetical protein